MTLPTAAASSASGTLKATIGRSTADQYINIPTGYNGTAVNYKISAVSNMTLPAAAASAATSGYASKATIGRSTSDQYINIPAGYNTAGAYYKVSAVANMTLPTAVAASAVGTVKATVSRSTSDQYINIPTGYNGSAASYKVSAVANMTLPTTAASTGSGSLKATITPGSAAQYINIPTGYNGSASYYKINASSISDATINPLISTTTDTHYMQLVTAAGRVGTDQCIYSMNLSGCLMEELTLTQGHITTLTLDHGPNAPSQIDNIYIQNGSFVEFLGVADATVETLCGNYEGNYGTIMMMDGCEVGNMRGDNYLYAGEYGSVYLTYEVDGSEDIYFKGDGDSDYYHLVSGGYLQFGTDAIMRDSNVCNVTGRSCAPKQQAYKILSSTPTGFKITNGSSSSPIYYSYMTSTTAATSGTVGASSSLTTTFPVNDYSMRYGGLILITPAQGTVTLTFYNGSTNIGTWTISGGRSHVIKASSSNFRTFYDYSFIYA